MSEAFSRPFRPTEITPSTLESFQLANMAAQLRSEHFGLDGAPGGSFSQIGRTMGLTRERVRLKKAAAFMSPTTDAIRIRDVA